MSGSARVVRPRRRSPRRRGSVSSAGRTDADRTAVERLAGVSAGGGARRRPAELRGVRACVCRSREFARPTGQYGSLMTWTTHPDDDPEDLDLEALDAPDVRGGGVLLRGSPARRRGATRWRRSAGAGARPRRPRRPPPPSRFATPLQWFGVAFFLSAIASGAFARAPARAAFQPIRAEGPAAHAASSRKTKTPTAGGVALVPAGAWRRSSSRARRTQPPTRSWRARFCSWPSGSRTTWGCRANEPGWRSSREPPNCAAAGASLASSPRCRTRASRR